MTERANRLLYRFDRIIKKDGTSNKTVRVFQKIICAYYRQNPRDLPWRRTRNPYRILISEMMLQQTQVGRVLGKYKLFVRRFPGFPSLAKAPIREILEVWQGLGYNRRALALKKIADIVTKDYHGKLPVQEQHLLKLPGIGRYSASAIVAFAYNKPSLFIETNIRRVFIHFFFHDRENITDAEIMPLVARTLDTANPREWYYGLMDYGVMLKEKIKNPNTRSAHYRRQTPFQGSNRQIRGRILGTLVRNPDISRNGLIRELRMDPLKVERNLEQLFQEGFLKKKGKSYVIA
jgi:A/G-specific adenine glycosylase